MIENIKHKGLALAVLAAAQFMVVLDATITNVALPAIQQSLGFSSESQLQWIVTAYALVFGGFLLLGGRFADLFGRRKILLTGIVVFAAASLLGGFAQNPGQLVVFRALQGLGGALLAPSALSLILTIFKEGPERNKALGIMSMMAAGGGAIGLLLGGLLTQYVDWRWIFFINVPVAALLVASTLKYVPSILPTHKAKLDLTGAVTITGGLMSLVYALAQAAQNGWTDGSTLLMFGISALLLAAFIVNELKVKAPLVPMSIFKRRNISGSSIIQLLMPASMFGMFFYLSIYLQHIQHYSPTMAGVANLPFTIMIVIVAAILSKKIAHLNPKIILVVAAASITAGLLYMSNLPVEANYWLHILPAIILTAGGMAGVFVTTTVVATSGVSHQESGLISGLLNTGQQIGGAIGLAVLTVVSTTVTRNDMLTANNPAAFTGAIVHGFQQGFLAASLFAVAAGVVALVILKTHKPTKSDLKHEAENEAEALPAVPGV
ncbi:MAG TPA: MFS transporter [Candidatus Saccharimonadales bacterium]|nr:MFS transporter [Candidatus Saccharimonadales bacterium]